MNIETLIQAAEYLERRDREAEHGYASTLPMPEDYHRRKTKSRKVQQNSRSTHNELEKSRRAHLRHCMERLKDIVPVGRESSRHTTLGLLTKAKSFIKHLEDADKKHMSAKDKLAREQRYLKRRLDQLVTSSPGAQWRLRVDRSLSECSTSTVSTLSNSSQDDDVDILGYGSSGSESDDVSSLGNSTDSGCVLASSPPLGSTRSPIPSPPL